MLLTLVLLAPFVLADAAGADADALVQRFEAGLRSWKASCAKPTPDGACVAPRSTSPPARAKRNRQPPPQGHCGEAPAASYAVVPRARKPAAAAQRLFREAADLWHRHPDSARPAPELDAAAGAIFHQAEPIYEEFLSVDFPLGLDFTLHPEAAARRRPRKRAPKAAPAPPPQDRKSEFGLIGILRSSDRAPDVEEAVPRETPPAPAPPPKTDEEIQDELEARQAAERVQHASNERLRAYLERKADLLRRGTALYIEVARMPSTWSIQAAARGGQMYAHFAEQLARAPIALGMAGDPAVVKAFCDTLQDQAAPYVARASEAFDSCVERGRQHPGAETDPWIATCEAELARLRPPPP